jgi:nitrite reductase/ring-hydroxylating ferredoxin subunit
MFSDFASVAIGISCYSSTAGMVFLRVAGAADVPPGTMKHVESAGIELVLVNAGGTVYALADRCAHMNAPLSRGVLDGNAIVCPLHFSRFDVKTGKKISGPMMGGSLPGAEKLPPESQAMMGRMMEIMKPVKTHDQPVFAVKIEGENIPVDSGSNFLFMIPFGKIRKK